jgi:hypothetical protein
MARAKLAYRLYYRLGCFPRQEMSPDGHDTSLVRAGKSGRGAPMICGSETPSLFASKIIVGSVITGCLAGSTSMLECRIDPF